MLCQFIFRNYKSYKDETIFDLQAVSKYGFENSFRFCFRVKLGYFQSLIELRELV